MKKIEFKKKLIISSLLGVFMGFILPHLVFYTFFTTNPLSIIPWGIVGIIVCLFAVNRKESILIAQVYLIFLTESFLLLGQLKFNSELLQVILLLAIVLVVSLICGLVMGLVVYYLKKVTLKVLK